MKCAWCGCTQSRVVDSRQNEDGTSIRRRRECEKCGRRFTTYERIELVPLMIIKKDQTREAFDLEKLRSGIVKSCEKRPVSLGEIDALVGVGREIVAVGDHIDPLADEFQEAVGVIFDVVEAVGQITKYD